MGNIQHDINARAGHYPTMNSDADEPVWKSKIRRVLSENGGNERAVSLGAGRNATWVRDVLKRESAPKATSLEGLADFCGRPVSWFFS